MVKIGSRAQVLVGNKCDMDEGRRRVPYSQGQALADEFGIKFFETSAKSNTKVDEVRAYFGTVSEALFFLQLPPYSFRPGKHLQHPTGLPTPGPSGCHHCLNAVCHDGR